MILNKFKSIFTITLLFVVGFCLEIKSMEHDDEDKYIKYTQNSWSSYLIDPIKSVSQFTNNLISATQENPERTVIFGLMITIHVAQVILMLHCRENDPLKINNEEYQLDYITCIKNLSDPGCSWYRNFGNA